MTITQSPFKRRPDKSMGRIVTRVSVENFNDPTKRIECEALVDTGASHMVLPSVWKEYLGGLETIRMAQIETATQDVVQGEICAPVRIQIEGFHGCVGEVLFVEMTPVGDSYEPLIGDLVLEQSAVGIDMKTHQLIDLKYFDLK